MNKELNEDMRTKQDLLFECSSLWSRLSDEIIKNENLKQQVKKQKELIDKAIEYVEGHKYTMKHYEPYGTPTGIPNYETQNIAGYRVLLDILKEGKNE